MPSCGATILDCSRPVAKVAAVTRSRHHRWIRWIAGAAVFGMLGGHWVVLQSIAWSRMLVDYSSARGLKQGVVMTFDGDHPCPMCCAIKEARQAANPTHDAIAPAPPLPRLDALLPVHQPLQRRTAGIQSRTHLSCLFSTQYSGEPPVPPPRLPLG